MFRIGVFFCLSLIFGCKPKEETPEFREGLLDLTHIQFSESNPLEIQGELKFYYKKFLNPGENFPKPDLLLRIPGFWQDKSLVGEDLPREGYATFVGRILLSEEQMGKELVLFVPDIASAYNLYIDGEKVGSAGSPGKTPETEIASIKQKLFSFQPRTKEVELLFHVSNFENNFGGFWGSPQLGTRENLQFEKIVTTARELFLLGAILIIGLYHFGLFFFRGKEKPILYFAIFCFLLGTRVGITGNRFFLEIFPNFPWDLVFRLEFATFYFAVPIFLLFLHYLFHEDSNRTIVKVFSLCMVPFFFTLLLPVSFFTRFVFGFQFLSIAVVVYSLTINAIAIYKKRPNAKIFLFGISILAFAVVYDIIRHSINYHSVSLTPYALLCFIFSQALILSSRIANALNQVEELANHLKTSNLSLASLTENLELLVTERTSQLNVTYNRLKRDLLLAKKIQSKILPDSQLEIPSLKTVVHFVPKDEVGGDLYDYCILDSGVSRFFVADATGHGIQAALYTMAIKSEYESVKRIFTKTDDLLKHLNTKIQAKFSGLKMVFSCIVIDIDQNLQKIFFSSAGHPPQLLVSKGNLQHLTRTGNIVGLRRIQDYGSGSISILPGDRLFLFTDGILEQKNELREDFGQGRLEASVQKTSEEPLENSVLVLLSELNAFRGQAETEDDTTLVAIEWVPTTPEE